MDALAGFLRSACALLALCLFLFLLMNALLAARKPAGEKSGPGAGLLHSAFYYVFTLVFDFAVGILLWIPLPGTPFAAWLAPLGALMVISGMAFALWGKLALGKNYFISTNLGAQTLAGQRLITGGPYAIVRHPMYSGIFVGVIGSLLLYQTWTTVFLIFIGLVVVRRALVEEKVLAMMFGPEWMEYSRRVPMFIPWIRPRDDRPPASPAG